jgi:hypothetical protein
MPAAWVGDPKTWAFQEGVESSEMNAEVRDRMMAIGPHLIARKTADESVTSSSILQDDNHLNLPVLANEVWQIEYNLLYAAPAAADLRIAFTFPSGGRIDASVFWFTAGTGVVNIARWSTATSPAADQILDAGGASVRFLAPIRGLYANGSTGGTLTLQWAQGTSDATATTLYANSTLYAVKLA